MAAALACRQVVITEPFQVSVRRAELPAPGPNQIRVRTMASFVSAGTELAVFNGTHQWLHDPMMKDWKMPFAPGYSAAGVIDAVGGDVNGWRHGDRVSYPGNHASAEILTLSHERGRLWRLPEHLSFEDAALACVARYGLGAAIRAGITLGRSVAVLGLGVIGQFALRCLKTAGAFPVVGIDSVAMRRSAAKAGGADFVIDPSADDLRELLNDALQYRGAEIVVDATGSPDGVAAAMRLAADAGQVVIVGSPRGLSQPVNFYDDLHRRFIEVTGAHGNMLFEPAHTRLAGAWTIDKAQHWLLAALNQQRLNLHGLITHTIDAIQLQEAYQGLLNNKEEYLGVMLQWS